MLLYADPIGIDTGWLEREIRTRWPAKRLLAVNGRRRVFRLDARAARGLALRRFLQKVRIVEFAFVAVFVLVTPLLLLWDLSRGRR